MGQRLKVKAAADNTVTERTPAKVESALAKSSKVEPVPSTKTGSGSVSEPGATYHTVAKGENLFRISKIYNVTVAELQEWNSLSTAYVREGQKIKVAKP